LYEDKSNEVVCGRCKRLLTPENSMHPAAKVSKHGGEKVEEQHSLWNLSPVVKMYRRHRCMRYPTAAPAKKRLPTCQDTNRNSPNNSLFTTSYNKLAIRRSKRAAYQFRAYSPVGFSTRISDCLYRLSYRFQLTSHDLRFPCFRRVCV